VAQYIYMGSIDYNDTVTPSAAYYSEEDKQLIWEITSTDVQERWVISQHIYQELGIPAEFKTYGGVGHTINSEIIDDVVAFFKEFTDE
jgi:hypothetical protein